MSSWRPGDAPRGRRDYRDGPPQRYDDRRGRSRSRDRGPPPGRYDDATLSQADRSFSGCPRGSIGWPTSLKPKNHALARRARGDRMSVTAVPTPCFALTYGVCVCEPEPSA